MMLRLPSAVATLLLAAAASMGWAQDVPEVDEVRLRMQYQPIGLCIEDGPPGATPCGGSQSSWAFVDAEQWSGPPLTATTIVNEVILYEQVFDNVYEGEIPKPCIQPYWPGREMTVSEEKQVVHNWSVSGSLEGHVELGLAAKLITQASADVDISAGLSGSETKILTISDEFTVPICIERRIKVSIRRLKVTGYMEHGQRIFYRASCGSTPFEENKVCVTGRVTGSAQGHDNYKNSSSLRSLRDKCVECDS